MTPLYQTVFRSFLIFSTLLAPFLGKAQCTVCSAVTQTINLSAKADTAWVQTGPSRSGTCCAGTNCVKFIVLVNPGSDLLSFNVTNPAPSGSAYYQIDCGPAVSIGQPACISAGQSSFCITYCKPGGDNPKYHISASKTVKASADATMRVGCVGTLTVGGLSASTVSWTSVSPGTAGAYNSYLSCTSGCTSTTLTPSAATPSLIAFRVSGSPISGCPGTNVDTIMVTVVPGMTTQITPLNPVICSGGSATTAITASATGGSAPYTYTWSNAISSSSTGVGAGSYTVLVGDNTFGCAPVSHTVTVLPINTPTAPVISTNAPLCSGLTLSLSASAAGSTYTWTGPNGFSSVLQNPSITASSASSGLYSVSATYSGCTGPPGTLSVTVHDAPATPTLSSNSPLCSGQNLVLNANFVSGATYSWTGPNGFSSGNQNPTIVSSSTLHSGSYSLVISKAGCQSPLSVVQVTVNGTPNAPLAGTNGPICAGNTLSLNAVSNGNVYNWAGPNGFLSSSQNPFINNAGTGHSGNYTVSASSGACTSAAVSVSVTVFPIPSTPGVSSNGPVCAGQTLSLSATPNGMQYYWSGPNGFSATAQNPSIVNTGTAAAGIYSLITSASGCSSPAGTVAVVINSTPAAPILSSNSPLCQNGSLQLNASPGGLVYVWSGPNGFSSASQNPSITGIGVNASGNYSATASQNGCVSQVAVTAVTVHPTPPAPTASGTSSLCAGQALTLSANLAGATAYSWTGPDGFSSAAQNPTISNTSTAATGIYSVTAVLNSCTSSAGSFSVTVNPIPATPLVTYSGPVCTGNTFSLTASPNGLSYLWSGPGGFTSSVQNPVVVATTTAAAGNYSLNVTSLGCQSAPATISVAVKSTPAPPSAGGTATLCAGSTLNLNANATGSVTFNWTGPNGFTSTSQNPSITNASTLATGMYSVTATANGCSSFPSTFSSTVFAVPATPLLNANTPLCSGQTLSLSTAPVSGATYSWAGPNGFNSSMQNPIVAGISTLATGSYSLFISVSGCGGAVSAISVSVNLTPAAPVITNNSPLCEGAALNLTAPSGADNYTWMGPATFSSSIQNPIITGIVLSAAGTYSAAITNNGCTSTFATTQVTVHPVPSAPVAGGPSVLCEGQTLTLSATPSGADAYNWTGPNGFVSTVKNPTLNNVSLSASGTYSVTRTINGCTSQHGLHTLTVNAVPAQPTVTNNSPICALQTLSLFAGGSGGTYSWSGPAGFTASVQNASLALAPVTAGGSYSVTHSVLGCVSAVAVTSVVIYPAAPTPTAGSNSPVCLGGTINFTQMPIPSATYSWSGPGVFNTGSQNTAITNAQITVNGTYSVFATVNGCPGNTATMSVLVSVPATVNAGPAATVCANNAQVVLTGSSTTGSGNWTSSGSGSFSPNGLNGTYNPSPADIAGGNISLTLTSTGNGGCVASKTVKSLYFTPAPTAYAGAAQTVCANNATVSLNGSVTIASGGIWSSSGSGTFYPNSSALSASYVPGSSDLSAGSVTLTLTTDGNGNCLPVSHSKVVTISPAPVIGAGTNPQFVCKNNPNLQLNGHSTTGAMTWASSGSGSFSPNGNVLNPVYYSSAADTTAGSITLTITSTSNGGCNAVSQTLALVYTNTLTVNAGISQTVCSNSPVALTGVSTTSAGIWAGNGSGVFSPSANSLTTTYIPSQADVSAGLVTFTLTSANNGGCNPVSSVVSVSILPGPVVNAGSNHTVCANNASVALAGSYSAATGAIWSSSGTGTFSPAASSMNVVYFSSPADTTAGQVTLSLTSTGNGSCSASTETILVSFSPAPFVFAGNDFSVCKDQLSSPLNGYVSSGAGTWTSLGSGNFSNSGNLNTSYLPSGADTATGQVQLILTSANNGGCFAVTDTIKITFNDPPAVSAGLSQTICANNASVALTGTSSTGSGSWSGSGSGSFSGNGPATVYQASGTDITSGHITFTFSSTNNGGCSAATSTVDLFVSPAPTVNAGADQTLCNNIAVIQLNGSFNVSAGAIWSSTGSGTFGALNTAMQNSYTPSAADTAAGFVRMVLISTGNGNCLAVSDSMRVTFKRPAKVQAGADLTICENGLQPQLNGFSGTGSGQWSTTGNGSFKPSAQILNPVYIPSQADSEKNVKLILTSADGVCGNTSDTLSLSYHLKPLAAFTTSARCEGMSTQFFCNSETKKDAIVSWAWRFDEDTSSLENPIYKFSVSGEHSVSLLVSDGWCSDSISSLITINPAPVPAFTHSILCGDSVRFTGQSSFTGTATWKWEFGDGRTSLQESPLHVYTRSEEYEVRLTVTSDSGCVAAYAETVRPQGCSVQPDIPGTMEPAIPSAFTPNGDGNNDILFVRGGPFLKLNFRVFNEWGMQIFTSTSQTQGWDGTYKSADQPVGRFIWTLEAEMDNNKTIKKAGEVLLNR